MFYIYFAIIISINVPDESELDIPNGENHEENEEEQDQPEVEEQEFYVEGKRNGSSRDVCFVFADFLSVLFALHVLSILSTLTISHVCVFGACVLSAR